MRGPITPALDDLTPLTKQEINDFFDDLDSNKDGIVTFEELETKCHQVHDELAPEPKEHHLLHPARRDLEKDAGHAGDGLHAFLCTLMPDCGSTVRREEFVKHVEQWQVPSQKQTDSKEQDEKDAASESRLPLLRRLRAYWAVRGPNICFMALVVALQIAMGVWQMVKYIQAPFERAALGWGVILAKTCAGVLYPTLFFMLLSMSRHLATFLRRSYLISKFINWDFTQAFHIYMSLCGLFFASLHAIGHLTGSFVSGSRPSKQENVVRLFGPEAVPKTYAAYVRSLPGWSGVVALGLFWVISLLSMPFVRKRSYEIFQMGHLLMFPVIGLLCAHGTKALLQFPMLGYWLAFPTLLVVLERSWRLFRGFVAVPATARILDNETMEITCKRPSGQDWRYAAGQYILLQVPQVSLFQWHPFTISSCRGNTLSVHVKFDGDWTNKLRDLVPDAECEIRVGIDGPFGAPAQRFYDYDCSIIVGGGIGITPFSAVLTDLEENFHSRTEPWADRRRPRWLSRSRSRIDSSVASDAERRTGSSSSCSRAFPKYRVDFHWTVREKNQLLWFSDLLNRAIEGASHLAKEGNLELKINTHVTAKRKNISTHVFRYLLDRYRTPAAPYSALTGLKQTSHFGRPDFDRILEKHFDDLVQAGVAEKRVGVFYCGTPVVGEILSDKCHELTARARTMALKIRYEFLIEVFG